MVKKFSMQGEGETHTKRSWTGLLVTGVILVLLSWFVWRVVYFANQIRNGGVNVADLNFQKTVSTISKLASVPVSESVTNVAIKNRPTLGMDNAPITIVEFGDFSCPFSRNSSFVMRSMAAKYPGQFKFIYRDFPIAEIHPFAKRASEAAACAGEQNKFWEYHDKLYQNQQNIDNASFEKFASQLNLDTARFHDCLELHTYQKQVEDDYQAGFDAGVRGTPTFFMNGNRIPGSIPEDVLESVLRTLNAQKNNTVL